MEQIHKRVEEFLDISNSPKNCLKMSKFLKELAAAAESRSQVLTLEQRRTLRHEQTISLSMAEDGYARGLNAAERVMKEEP